MNDNWRERLHLFLRQRIPLISTFLLMMLFMTPVGLMQVNYFRPMVGVCCVFYWVLKKEAFFGYFSAFIIGFCADIASSSPLGVNILLFLWLTFAAKWLAHYFRSATFGVNWFIFGLTFFCLVVLKWLLLMLYFGKVFSCGEILVNYLVTVMSYPLIAGINWWIQRNFLPQEKISE